MDPKSTNFKILSLAQKRKGVLKNVTNNQSHTENRLENKKCATETESDDTNLQSAKENLLEENKKAVYTK